MSGYISPSAEQLGALGNLDLTTPVVMLNLLRFADQAPDDSVAAGMTGEEAYAEYGRRVLALGEGVFLGTPVASGTHLANVIGPADEMWDDIVVVRYESLNDFFALALNPEYAEVAKWRTAALKDSRLTAFNESRDDTRE